MILKAFPKDNYRLNIARYFEKSITNRHNGGSSELSRADRGHFITWGRRELSTIRTHERSSRGHVTSNLGLVKYVPLRRVENVLHGLSVVLLLLVLRLQYLTQMLLGVIPQKLLE